MKKLLVGIAVAGMVALLAVSAMAGYYNKTVEATITVNTAIDFWTGAKTVGLIYDEGGTIAYDDNGNARTSVSYTSNHEFQASIYLDNSGGDIPQGTRLVVAVGKGSWTNSDDLTNGVVGVVEWERKVDGLYYRTQPGAANAVAMFDAGPNANIETKTVDIAICGCDAMATIGTYIVDLVWVVSAI